MQWTSAHQACVQLVLVTMQVISPVYEKNHIWVSTAEGVNDVKLGHRAINKL